MLGSYVGPDAAPARGPAGAVGGEHPGARYVDLVEQIDPHERNSLRPHLDKAIPDAWKAASAYSDAVARATAEQGLTTACLLYTSRCV